MLFVQCFFLETVRQNHYYPTAIAMGTATAKLQETFKQENAHNRRTKKQALNKQPTVKQAR